MSLILASQSPRRRELLGLFGIPFTVRVADIDETMNPAAPADSEVARVSRLKALATPRSAEDVVVAADTIVVCQGRMLGKPHDENEARQMLLLLSGKDHQVMTGVTVLAGQQEVTFTEVTDLHFRLLSRREIDRYIASGEPMDKSGVPIWKDKAGAYGIQDPFGAMAVQCIKGDYYNVMGLPVSRLYKVLKELGIEL